MAEISPGRVIWGLRCPECGQGHLLQGVLKPREACEICGHDFRGYAGADGPAYLAILVVSTLVVVAATYVEIAYEPSYWLHAALWTPLIVVLSILCLRHAKGWIAAMHHRHRIREPKDLHELRAGRSGHGDRP